MTALKVIECPRDAMQGIHHPISTEKKIAWMRQLLQCGFDTLDCGSFVSAAHVPQMADTHEVLQAVTGEKGNNKFLVIVANERGAKTALTHSYVDYIGFPFSVNETFQQRNTNSSREDAFILLQKMHNMALDTGKEMVAYISMAFGNPYGEAYNREEVVHWAEKIALLGIKTISLADTVGSAKNEDISYLFSKIKNLLPEVEIGAHLHATPGNWEPKISAAWESGCRRFDGAMLGLGGCPMASDELTGNIPTEFLVHWLNQKSQTHIQMDALNKAVDMAPGIYS